MDTGEVDGMGNDFDSHFDAQWRKHTGRGRDNDADGNGIPDDEEDGYWGDRWNSRHGYERFEGGDQYGEGSEGMEGSYGGSGGTRYGGLTDEEWAAREAEQAKYLEELQAKEKELGTAREEVTGALQGLMGDKEAVDGEIKDKVTETEELRREFR